MKQARDRDRFIRGVSIGAGKACTYSIPERWLLHGRSHPGTRGDRPKPSPELAQAANVRRIVSRYWQAVGWLWLRSKGRVVDLGQGRKMPFRQGLLTLTLPGVASGDHLEIKRKVLDPFFTYARNVLGLRDYVWVAELQERGEIHFHVIVNQFLQKDKLRAAWISACERSGVVTMSVKGSLPATEIEACKSFKGSRAYAAKYMAKGLRSGAIVGRVWSGSHSVTGIKPMATNELEQAWNAPAALREVDERCKGWRQYDHNVRVAHFDIGRITYRRSPVLYMLFRNHLRQADQPKTPHDHRNARANASTYGSSAPRSALAQPAAIPPACGGHVDRPVPVPIPRHGHARPAARAISGRGTVAPSRYRADEQPDLWGELGQFADSGIHYLAS